MVLKEVRGQEDIEGRRKEGGRGRVGEDLGSI